MVRLHGSEWSRLSQRRAEWCWGSVGALEARDQVTRPRRHFRSPSIILLALVFTESPVIHGGLTEVAGRPVNMWRGQVPDAEVAGEGVGEVGLDAVGEERDGVVLGDQQREAVQDVACVGPVVELEDVDDAQALVASVPDDEAAGPVAVGSGPACGLVNEPDGAARRHSSARPARRDHRRTRGVAGVVSSTAALRKRARPAWPRAETVAMCSTWVRSGRTTRRTPVRRIRVRS
jgi:hypothetical protein